MVEHEVLAFITINPRMAVGFLSIGGFGKFGGPWNALDQKIQILSDIRFSDFWPNFRFSYFFWESLSKTNQKG